MTYNIGSPLLRKLGLYLFCLIRHMSLLSPYLYFDEWYCGLEEIWQPGYSFGYRWFRLKEALGVAMYQRELKR